MRSRAVAKRHGLRAKPVNRPRSLRVLSSLSAALLVLSLLGLFDSVFWFGSAARELCQWSLLVSGLLVLFALLRRFKWLLAVNLVTFALTALPLWPLFRPMRPTPAGGPVLHVASATFRSASPSPAEVARFIARESLDVLALVRVPQDSLPAIDRAVALKRIATAGPPASRRVLYARAPQSKFSAAAGREDARRIRIGRCNVELAVMDVPSALDPMASRARASALSDLPRASRTGFAIWLGHFGGRADAADLRRQEALVSLRDTREGHGLLATAPAWLYAFGRPVDHALVQGFIAVRERGVRAPLTSGAHRSVTATLELTDKRCF